MGPSTAADRKSCFLLVLASPLAEREMTGQQAGTWSVLLMSPRGNLITTDCGTTLDTKTISCQIIFCLAPQNKFQRSFLKERKEMSEISRHVLMTELGFCFAFLSSCKQIFKCPLHCMTKVGIIRLGLGVCNAGVCVLGRGGVCTRVFKMLEKKDITA